MKLFPDTASTFFLLFIKSKKKKKREEREQKSYLFVTCIRRVLKCSKSALNLHFCIANLRMQA